MPRYERLFSDMGAQRVTSLDFDTRRDAEEPGRLERLRQASGVFFTGGNQLRLSTLIGGTSVAKAVRQMNAVGIPVAGTSAGAAFISEHMIAFGDEGSTPIAGSVRLAPGLGLTNRFIIDQHFRQRDRLGRLLTALAYNPFAVGIGLDEDTAAFIGPDNTVHVEGSGGITVVDASEVQFSSMDEVNEGRPVCLLGRQTAYSDAGCDFQPAYAAAGRRRTRQIKKLGPDTGAAPMRILERNVYVGPSMYAHFPVIKLLLDLGALEQWPSGKLGPDLRRHAAGRAARASRARLLVPRARWPDYAACARMKAPGSATCSSTSQSSCRTSRARM